VIEVGDLEGLYRLVGKTMLDAEFRAELLGDPEAAAERVGASLTPDQVSLIREADPEEVEALVHDFQRVIVAPPHLW
jgi:hypothetical protein